ncbi:MAG: tetratricopeptide repeat protein, partial [Hyphomicrobiaceae bacterium]|nr:tetratricopeptide repeat protein [Hyphomicrobiaceae bacterium]
MHKTFFIATVLLASVLSGPSPAQTNSATEIEFWRSISNSTDSAEFEAYLKAYPSGQFTDLAKIRLSKLKPASPPDNTTASGATESGKIANDASLQSMNDRVRRESKNSDILNDRGNWYFKNKDFDKAIADYTKVVEIKPDSFAGFFNRGLAYQEKSEHLRAAADFSRAIERKSEEAVAWSSRGWSRFMADDTTGAITDFTKALELDRNNTGTRLNRGKAYTKQGDYVRALADYDRVIEVAPQSAHAHEMRGWTLVAVGRYEDGQRDLAKMASLGQPAYGIIHGFGCVDGWKKRIFAETIANCTALSFIDDRTLNTIRRRDALLSIGEYERAATAQRQIAPMMATDSYLRDDSREGTVEDRGLAALETGRLEYAKWIFATNNKQYSQDARSRVGLALVHLAENNPKAAIELLNEVMGFKGDQLGTLMVRGRAHMANKSPLDAVIDFSAVIEARPNDVEARVARGSAHLAGGATDKAKLDAQHAMNLNPRLAGIYELRAGIAEAEGDKELAVEQLGEALLRHRNSLSALKSRARLLTSLGQVQSARRDESQVEQLSHDLELALRASRRPWFGIIFYDVNAGEAKDVKGAVVKSQYEGPASHAGLEQGDVITSLDGRQIASGTEFATHATTLEIGKSVRIAYTRNGVENDALIAPASSDYERCNNRSDWAHVREACTISLKNDGLDTKTRSSALANRGGSFHEANLYAPAIADLTAAIELNPKNLGAVHKRGNAKAKSGDHIGAIVDFDTDIKALPNDQYAFADRGDSYRRLGQCETAISDFEAALKHEGSEGMSYS